MLLSRQLRIQQPYTQFSDYVMAADEGMAWCGSARTKACPTDLSFLSASVATMLSV